MSKPSSQRLLYQFVNSCIQLQQSYNKQFTLEAQCNQYNIPKLLNLINFKDIEIQKDRQISQIGIYNLYERHPLRISVYYIPKNLTMKLHDHPGIEVVNYLLSGSLEARIFSNIQGNVYSKRIEKLSKGSMSFIDGKREKKQNLHQFKALEPSYFLDVIFPDYNQERECGFYEQEEQLEDGKVKLRRVLNYEVQFTYLY